MPLGTSATRSTTSRARLLQFVAVCAVCVAGGVGYAMYSAWRAQLSTPNAVSTPLSRLEIAPTPSERAITSPLASETPGSAPTFRPFMLFRSTALGESYGRVSRMYLDGADDSRHVSQLQCDRVHFAAARGLCLEAKRGVFTTFQAHIFDRDLHILRTLPLTGIPSRARLSPDGNRAAFTVFVSGHSYAGADFSTRTSIVDAVSGKMLAEDLESFLVLKNGAPFKAQDFNFWGVTFSRDSNRFYATLGSGGQFYLIEGDVNRREARIVHAGVECPSLSPDNRRIAFKRRVGAGERLARFAWRLYVLDLATLAETALPGETRNVDDQVEWLDNDQIVYALPDDVPHATAATNTWALASDGTGAPRLVQPLAFSPAVVR
jgi:WD40-like Beta Propeller Repeat